jgi:hypothetical protein
MKIKLSNGNIFYEIKFKVQCRSIKKILSRKMYYAKLIYGTINQRKCFYLTMGPWFVRLDYSLKSNQSSLLSNILFLYKRGKKFSNIKVIITKYA